MTLNARQLQFVKEYLIDKNATRAAKAVGYSAKTAYAQGHRLLKHAEIQREIEKGLEAQRAQAEERAAQAGLTKERWLQELRLVALSNIDDHVVIEEKELYQGEDGESVMVTTVKAKLTKDRPRKLGRAIKKISETKNGIGIEMHSKLAALDLLGKHYGWVKNDFEIPPANNVQVILTMPDNGRTAKKEDKQ